MGGVTFEPIDDPDELPAAPRWLTWTAVALAAAALLALIFFT